MKPKKSPCPSQHGLGALLRPPVLGIRWRVVVEDDSGPAWDDEDLAPLRQVPASAFEVVKLGPIRR